MRVSTVLAIAIVALVCATVVRADDEDKNVLVLSGENFDETIAKHELTLVEFYAPWCGHCKALAPEYNQAADTLAEGDDDIKLAKVDCTEDANRDLCSRFDVKGFPTIKLFRNNGASPAEYDQARKANAMVKFLKKQNQPAITELSDADAVKNFAKEDDVQIIAFAAADTDKQAYADVAGKMRNEFSFGIVFDQDDLAKEYGVTSPGVVMRRNFDDGDVVFSGEFGAENFASELTDFIKGQSFPLVGEIGPETYQKYIERGFNFVWIFVDYNDEAQTAMIKDAITPSAAEYRSELSFVKLDGIRWGEHAKSFGLSGGTPGIVIEDREKRANFVFPEDSDITADAFAKFVASYKDGSLKAHVKSDPEPETNDGPVFVLVGDAFERVAKDTTKDVLVEFYAPWCGHCKKLAPIYEEVGEAFADNDNVIIAKMDSTTNDAIGEDIRGFPTIKFYPAGDDQTAVEYDGGRTKDDMIKFINENGKAGAAAASSEEPASEEAGHDEL